MANLLLYRDDDIEVTVPHTWEICSTCRGEGQSSAYLGAYTMDEMDEAGPEFFHDYMAGEYDRACDECGGSGKVKVADFSRMTAEMQREWRDQCRADREIDAEMAAERRMGC